MEKLELKHYRYERNYNLCDDGAKIELVEFKTLRETKCGYWILKASYYKERFILKEGRKKYAYLTKKEAFNSFEIRTNKAAGYAKRDLDNARAFQSEIDKFDINTL